MSRFSLISLCCMFLGPVVLADEPQFSGPQVGEKLSPFQARDVFGEKAGEDIDVLADVRDSPLLLVFVHKVTRPSVALSRLLMEYANTKKDAGLETRLVFLTNDPPDTEAWFRRARHALPKDVPPLISTDGLEGPGAYGLNRKMTATVLVANKGKVTANLPLVQPSIQVDAPKIGHAIVKVLGGDAAPTLAEMGFHGRRMKMRKQAKLATTPEPVSYTHLTLPTICSV